MLDNAIYGIKAVWNLEAYEARERSGIDHSKIFMAALVQEGINGDSFGVMITADPYDREDKRVR
jgi:phosphoenolpyruvate synthase/pyruvate phosphate dikinase